MYDYYLSNFKLKNLSMVEKTEHKCAYNMFRKTLIRYIGA